MNGIRGTYDYNMIYVFSIPDEKHNGLLKIGLTTVKYFKDNSDLVPNCKILNDAAHERIKKETLTAAIEYNLEYTELAIIDPVGKDVRFDDHEVHKVLINSGYKRVEFDNIDGKPNEWFDISLDLAKKAIAAVKNGQIVLDKSDWKTNPQSRAVNIDWRDEQKDAVTKTLRHFKNESKMLWDAKMRFGKTLCALNVVKENPFTKVLILTHRPAVRDGWFDDYNKIGLVNYHYITRKGRKLCVDGRKVAGGLEILKAYTDKDPDFRYIYFASLQDIRGSKKVNKKSSLDKNNEIFKEKWDLLIIDEAHEGIRTEMGKAVVAEFQKNKKLKSLYLSGTPYNILNLFSDDDIYRWDYVMEQAAKENWESIHPGEPNKYEGLARLNILTYDLGDVFRNYSKDDNDFFSFSEFFRVDDIEDKFVHEKDVRDFLKLMTKDGDNKELNYPFATEEYRSYFHHTLWSLPGVKAARCLSALLREMSDDNIFRDYYIVNVAGSGDDVSDIEKEDSTVRAKKEEDALQKVRKAIKEHDKTITLTCGRLTTGVSVPEWTAVLMLSGSYETKASRYLQTIFRCQTPFKDGRIKRECYAFDFAPDRTVTVIDEYITHISHIKGKSRKSKAQMLDDLLHFLPVIAINGSKTTEFDAQTFMKRVNKAFAEQFIQKGGKDRKLFLLDDIDDNDFNFLKEIENKIGKSAAAKKGDGKTKVNAQGLEGEAQNGGISHENSGQQNSKPNHKPKESTQVSRAEQAWNILEKISIRFPMLIYGAVDKMDKTFQIEQFIKNIDDESWNEFMPGGFATNDFMKILHLIDNEKFIALASSILERIRDLEDMTVDERVNAIADVISNFRYPDKETVLTPWRVVNMHLGSTLGGYNFYGGQYRDEDQLYIPRFVDNGDVTCRTFNPNARILELNSKTGLYPLYMAFSIYREKCTFEQGFGPDLSVEQKSGIWRDVIENNIFVICKTKMAEKITIRTLAGLKKMKVNALYYENIIETLKKHPDDFVKDVRDGMNFWKTNKNQNMKFNAIVSNPPYNQINDGDGHGADPLYHLFIDAGMMLADLGTMIHPARFLFNVGKTPKEWNQRILNDEHFRIVNYWDNGDAVFPLVDIKGGVAISLWDKTQSFDSKGFFSPYNETKSILEKVKSTSFVPFSSCVSARDLYRLNEAIYKENPKFEGRQSKGHKYDLGSNVFDIFPEVFFDDCPANENDEYCQVYGLLGKNRIYKWIKKTYVKQVDGFDKYRIFIPKSSGSGAYGEVFGTPVVGMPNVAHTLTFLSIGPFKDVASTNAAIKYIKTKFVRALLGTIKVTQDNSRSTWKNVPLQDFTSNSDIDWTLSIDEIDNQLFAKYHLDSAEIEFIRKMIKEMK